MLKIFNDGPINKIDHFVFHHKLMSIFMTFFIIAIIFFLFLVARPENTEASKSSIEYLLGVFTQGLLNWPGEGGDYDTYLLLLSITGTFLLSGFLYAVITNALMGRSDKYKDGKLRYKVTGHTVVLGANSLLESTLDHLDKKEKFNKEQKWIPQKWEKNKLAHFCRILRQKLFSNYIIIVSSQTTQTIRNRTNRYDYIRNHVVVYNDVLDDDQMFHSLNLRKAREVFVLGDDEPKTTDVLNVRLVNKVIDCFSACRNRRPHGHRLACNVSYFNASIVMSMLSDSNPKLDALTISNHIDIRPYNYLDGCLSFYWGSKCLGRCFSNGADDGNHFSLMPKDNKRYHFVVIGFNDLACHCVRKICSLAHFGKGSMTHISMITPDALRFGMFRDDLGVDRMPDITLDHYESPDHITCDDDGVLRYYVVATADAELDRMWMKHLSTQEYACLLGYAEDYEDEVNAEIKYTTTPGQNIGYWGFKKLRTHLYIEKNEFRHAKLLHEAYCRIHPADSTTFTRLFPQQQMAWIDFYNYLYYLITVSGCQLHARPRIEVRGKTEKEITEESAREQQLAMQHTLSALASVRDAIDHALSNYKAAQTALHRGHSNSARHYKGQLDIICGRCHAIMASYLALANQSGLELIRS